MHRPRPLSSAVIALTLYLALGGPPAPVAPALASSSRRRFSTRGAIWLVLVIRWAACFGRGLKLQFA